MPRVPIGDAQPGQKLQRPAVTRTGMVMVQPGTELTAAIIERLRNLGIDGVYIEGASRQSDKAPEVALQELEERFAGHERDAWMMQLKAIVARQIAGPAEPPPPPASAEDA